MTSAKDTPLPRLRSATGRWIVAATVLGSSIAMLDATVVNIALPKIGTDLEADTAGLQWVISGYTLTLASFILLGGSLGDQLGRRKVFVWGTIGFALTSLACGLAPTIEVLIVARILQGVAGALLTPGSLALISSSIAEEDQGSAVGLWSGLGGIAGAIGPFLGGWIVEFTSWRVVFLLNVPLAALVVWVALVHVPESRDPHASGRIDLPGNVVVVAGLGALTYGLIESHLLTALLGVGLLALFVVVELRSRTPMVPPKLFAAKLFVATNLVTFAVYIALSGMFFLFVLQLQIVSGYSPLAAGIASLPVTVLMLALSSRAGQWSHQHGARIPMTVGPLLAAAGLLLMLRIGPEASYLFDVLPGVLVFGLGLSALVAPLTRAVLGSVSSDWAGIASGVNNAVARTAGLLAVAALPGLAGMSATAFGNPAEFSDGFRNAMLICAGLLVVGAVLAFAMVERSAGVDPQSRPGCIDCQPQVAIAGTAVQPGRSAPPREREVPSR